MLNKWKRRCYVNHSLIKISRAFLTFETSARQERHIWCFLLVFLLKLHIKHRFIHTSTFPHTLLSISKLGTGTKQTRAYGRPWVWAHTRLSFCATEVLQHLRVLLANALKQSACSEQPHRELHQTDRKAMIFLASEFWQQSYASVQMPQCDHGLNAAAVSEAKQLVHHEWNPSGALDVRVGSLGIS